MDPETPNRKKTKKIRTLKIRGALIDGAPKDDDARFIWEKVMGYKQLLTGEWYEPKPLRLPHPDLVREFPYPQNCKACKSRFRSKKYYDAYCPSCTWIMEEQKRELERILDGFTHATADSGRLALEKVLDVLRCPTCEWEGNAGRYQPKSLESLRDCLNDWIESAHLHWMRHNFWNRFSTKAKSLKRADWEKHEKERAFFEMLAEYARKHPPIIEIECPEENSPSMIDDVC
jgi:hypothetical protein